MENNFGDNGHNSFVQVFLFYFLYFFACCINKNNGSGENPGSSGEKPVNSQCIIDAHAVSLDVDPVKIFNDDSSRLSSCAQSALIL